MKVRIRSLGNRGGATIEVLDADGAVKEELPACYAYRVEGEAGHPPARATLFVLAEQDVTADGEVVGVSRSLIARARDMSARLGNPAVTAAFGELLGVSMRAKRPEA